MGWLDGTGSAVGRGEGLFSDPRGELVSALHSVSHGMAVCWLVPGVDGGGALLRKGSCSIEGKDPTEDSSAAEAGVVGLSTVVLKVSFGALLQRSSP